MPYSPSRRAVIDRRRRWALAALIWEASLVAIPIIFGVDNLMTVFLLLFCGTFAFVFANSFAFDRDRLGKFALGAFGIVHFGLVFALVGLFLTLGLAVTELGFWRVPAAFEIMRGMLESRDIPDMPDSQVLIVVVAFTSGFTFAAIEIVRVSLRDEIKVPRPLRSRMWVRQPPFARTVRKLIEWFVGTFVLATFAGFLFGNLLPGPADWLIAVAGVVAFGVCLAGWVVWFCTWPQLWFKSLRLILALAKIR
jgi:hypothetical protein